jgi:hypothetical protein
MRVTLKDYVKNNHVEIAKYLMSGYAEDLYSFYETMSMLESGLYIDVIPTGIPNYVTCVTCNCTLPDGWLDFH